MRKSFVEGKTTTMTRRCLLLAVATVALFVLAGFAPDAKAASAPKVEICHIPPDDPANFHTITVSANALPAHLAHGDLGGACNASCAIFCDDGDACTIDDTGDCESEGCPAEPRTPVDCNDDNLCTDDSCDPATGCENSVVTCDAPDRCTISMCAPDTGECVDSPVVCPEGFHCSLETGECIEEAGPDPECAGQTCGNFTTCNGGGSCGTSGVCGSTAEGGGLCVDGSTGCGGLTACPGGSGDCAPGDLCFFDSCCGGPVCVSSSRFCSEPPEGATSSATNESTAVSAKPTFASEGDPPDGDRFESR